MSGLSLEGISLQWADSEPLFRDLSLELRSGQSAALVGTSGCGKSSLLRIAAGLLKPSSGSISARSEGLAFVFQQPTLLPWRSALANVTLPLEIRGVPLAAARERALHMLNMVGLAQAAELLPRELSGGMQMRASLARALVTEPELLLLDEPFASVDAATRRSLHALFLSLHEEHGFTSLLVTHDLGEALLLGDRVLVMSAQRPATFLRDIQVDLPRPRRLHDPALGELLEALERAL